MPLSLRDRVALSRTFRRLHQTFVAPRRNTNRFLGIFESFAQAEGAAPTGSLVGYDNPQLASWYRERLDHVHSDDYPVLFWLERCLADTRSVFDFGGHIGIHYFSFGTLLKWPPDLHWTVCEVPAVVESGRRLAHERGSPAALGFTIRPEDADGSDLFLASGSLQYLPPGFLHDLLRGLSRRPRRLLINKQPLHASRAYVTLQDTRVSLHPYRIDWRDEWLAGLHALGYRVVDSWMNPEHDCRVLFRPELDVPAYSGFYLERAG
jgi:putative methyltransferase (TIGR04325 family)